MSAISDNVLEHEHVHCLFPTDLLFSLPCPMIDGTGRNRKQCSKLRLVPITKLTIDELFYDYYYERDDVTRRIFFFGVGRRGGGNSAQSLAQFLLQVSYKKMKDYSKGNSKVLLCKGKT